MRFESQPEGYEDRPVGSEGWPEVSEGQPERCESQPEGSEGPPWGSEGQPERFEGHPQGGHTDGRMDEVLQDVFPYQGQFPTVAKALHGQRFPVPSY